eukprot:3813893-Karenia_brevis.AAC.1
MGGSREPPVPQCNIEQNQARMSKQSKARTLPVQIRKKSASPPLWGHMAVRYEAQSLDFGSR